MIGEPGNRKESAVHLGGERLWLVRWCLECPDFFLAPASVFASFQSAVDLKSSFYQLYQLFYSKYTEVAKRLEKCHLWFLNSFFIVLESACSTVTSV